MPLSVIERVRALRDEIIAIKEMNDISKHQKNSVADAERERRRQRLQEIQAELTGMTEWKKP